MIWLAETLTAHPWAANAASLAVLGGAWLLLNGTGVLARETVRDWRARRRTTTALAGLAEAVAAFPPAVSPELLHAEAELYAPAVTIHQCGCATTYLPGGDARLSPCPPHARRGDWLTWEQEIKESSQ